MHVTPKPSFLHSDQFNAWLITSFFLVFTTILFAFIPVIGLHKAGVAVVEELSRYAPPTAPRIEAPKPGPVRAPLEGVPVAYGTGR